MDEITKVMTAVLVPMALVEIEVMVVVDVRVNVRSGTSLSLIKGLFPPSL